MTWELAHHPRGVYHATTATIEAGDSAAAIAQLRSTIPADHLGRVS
ncbi:hypothetical protein [Lacisediminihabitans changchengi]|uniref:Uncharacterized protein n=1 Tax=Lacisediminihabitans changchengi TaxID=2787634 RepID=A0A934SK77_9MICO|nr:hypothetical protein [Lacisediminihabitans changchengi]MBK4347098.1 hypothetical protein [Lacisediminihabitans changchengi]MBK4347779.1 hypothetical protein [Lacisediminihabitans changchengi]